MSRNRARSRARALSIFSDSAIDLNFIPIAGTSPALDPRITFTRSTTGTYVNNAGVLTSAAINSPRFDYDPVTLALKGLLIEEQRTNLVLQSQDFATTWATSASLTIATNTTTAPDGTITADTVSATTTASYCFQDIIFSADGTKAYSIFLKSGTSGRSRIFIRDQTAGISRGDAVITWTGGIPSVVMSLGSLQGIQAYANGWYRLQVIVDSVVAANSNQFRIFPDNIAGTGSMIVWGAQIENAAFSTSYIPTTTAAVTRAADLASMTGTNFSSWYNQTEGTLYAEYVYSATGVANSCAYSLDNGTGNETVVNASAAPNIDRVLSSAGGVPQANFGNFSYSAGQIIQRAVAIKLNDAATTANGSTVATDTSYTMPSPTQLVIGAAGYFTSSRLNGHIRRIVYYPTRLSNEELQALTSYSRNIPLWTPTQISTALWLDAADASTLTLNGSTVSQWADKSGNGRNVVQAVASSQPTSNTRTLNGLNVLDFNVNFLRYSTPFVTINTPWLVYSVITFDNFTGGPVYIGLKGAQTTHMGYTVGGNIQVYNDTIGTAALAGSVITANTPALVGVQYDTTNLTGLYNGAAQGSPAVTLPADTEFFNIGNHSNGISNTFDGTIGEIVFIQSAVSLSNRQKLEGYLAWKWGLQANLPAGHPYKNVPPLL
jgi:hypothetical protein